MSSIINVGRAIMACAQQLTGTRSTGSILITASGDDVTVPRNRYLLPVIGGRRRPDLAVKAAAGPNSDYSWTVTSSGTSVSALSNIGGRRMNYPDGTVFAFDPPLSGIASAVAGGAFTGGADLTTFGALRDFVMYETVIGPNRGLDAFRANVMAFPAAMLAWVDDEPYDGSSSDMTNRQSRAGTRKSIYKATFQIVVFSERTEDDHARRSEGLEALDQLASLLVDRQAIDGEPFSNPSGLQIRRRWRETGRQDIYQRFYVYGLLVSAMVTLQRAVSSSGYSAWNTSVIDVSKRDEGETDFPLIDDMTVDMTS